MAAAQRLFTTVWLVGHLFIVANAGNSFLASTYPNPHNFEDRDRCGSQNRSASFICDPDLMLTLETIMKMDTLIEEIWTSNNTELMNCSYYTGIRIAVAIVPEINMTQNEKMNMTDSEVTEVVRQFADDLRVENWKPLGQCGQNLVIVLSVEYRKLATSAGPAANKVITDECIQEVQNEHTTQLQKGNFGEVLIKTLETYKNIMNEQRTCHWPPVDPTMDSAVDHTESTASDQTDNPTVDPFDGTVNSSDAAAVLPKTVAAAVHPTTVAAPVDTSTGDADVELTTVLAGVHLTTDGDNADLTTFIAKVDLTTVDVDPTADSVVGKGKVIFNAILGAAVGGFLFLVFLGIMCWWICCLDPPKHERYVKENDAEKGRATIDTGGKVVTGSYDVNPERVKEVDETANGKFTESKEDGKEAPAKDVAVTDERGLVRTHAESDLTGHGSQDPADEVANDPKDVVLTVVDNRSSADGEEGHSSKEGDESTSNHVGEQNSEVRDEANTAGYVGNVARDEEDGDNAEGYEYNSAGDGENPVVYKDNEAGDDDKATGYEDNTGGYDNKAAGYANNAMGDEEDSARNEYNAAGDDYNTAGHEDNTGGYEYNSAGEDDTSAGDDYNTAGVGYNTAGDDDTGAGDDYNTAGDDDTGAGDDHNTAGDDDTGAGDDYNTAGDDDTGAGDDYNIAGDDDTGAGDDYNIAGDDDTGAGDNYSADGDEDNTAGVDDTANRDEDNTGEGEDNAAVNEYNAGGDEYNANGENYNATEAEDNATGNEDTTFVNENSAEGYEENIAANETAGKLTREDEDAEESGRSTPGDSNSYKPAYGGEVNDAYSSDVETHTVGDATGQRVVSDVEASDTGDDIRNKLDNLLIAKSHMINISTPERSLDGHSNASD